MGTVDFLRSSSQTRRPLIPGIITSKITRSTSELNTCSAFAPLSASRMR